MLDSGEGRFIDYAFVDEVLATYGVMEPEFAANSIGEVNGQSSMVFARFGEMDDPLFKMTMDIMNRISQLSKSSDPELKKEREKLARFQQIMLTRPTKYDRARQAATASPSMDPTTLGLVGLGLGGMTGPSWGKSGSTTERLNRISLDVPLSSVPISRTKSNPLPRRPPPELPASISATVDPIATPSLPGRFTMQPTSSVTTAKGKTLKAGFLQNAERLLNDSSPLPTVKTSSPKTPQAVPELSKM